MTDIQVFKNEQFGEVRTIVKDGEPWFVAADVCKALEVANSRDAVARLDEDEKGVVLTDTLGGQQKVTVVSEAGLYTSVRITQTTLVTGKGQQYFINKILRGAAQYDA